MDIQFQAEGAGEIEQYKVYMYTMFAKEVGRYMRRYILGKIFVQPDPKHDALIVNVERSLDGVISGEVHWTCKICDVLDLMKADEARGAAKATVKKYKDEIWHMFCKDYKKTNSDSSESEEIKVNTYDDDVKRLFYKQGMSPDQIADSLGITVDAVNEVI